ncbi:hypothetical protein ACVINU_002733 [Bradyrhizobium diazoefficiens]
MKLAMALILASLPTTAVYADVYNYSCKACLFPGVANENGSDGCDVVEGKSYPLRVDDSKNVLEWRGRKYKITTSAEDQLACGKYGWRAEGEATSFKFCTATQGYGAIEDKDGAVRARCDLKRR